MQNRKDVLTMQITKKITSIIIALAISILNTLPAMAATPQYLSNQESRYTLQYVNINTTFLTQGEDWISANCTAKAEMDITITVKVYKSGKLVDTFSSSTYGRGGNLYTDYTFESGASYIIKATYKVGSESTTKSISFTAK